MLKIITKLLNKRMILPEAMRKVLREELYLARYFIWKYKPTVPPPHVVKIKKIRKFAREKKINVLVETGTYYGDTVDCLKDDFNKVYSVELDRNLYERAKRVFRNNLNVKLFNGDSAVVLPDLLKDINKPVIFWLDAHYSGCGTAKGSRDSPIEAEIKEISIMCKQNYVILIDDAREFTGVNSYPRLKPFLGKLKKTFPDHNIFVEDDIICVF